MVDNHSTNQSLDEINAWLCNNNIKSYKIEEGDSVNSSIEYGDCIVYALTENYGFAKGNNLGLKLISNLDCDYYLCLNNDTVVTPTFLTTLITFQQANNKIEVLTPQIRYFGNKELIWNCGGRIFAGFRKYFYAQKHVSSLPQKEYIPVSFITGCALFFTKDSIVNDAVFTERFFFGEEDFEFCLRQKRKGTNMACVLQSVIYHKVSASVVKEQRLSHIFVYYINRFINIRLNYSKLYYLVWRCINIFYIKYRILKSLNMDMKSAFIHTLKNDSLKYNSIDRARFEYYCKKFQK